MTNSYHNKSKPSKNNRPKNISLWGTIVTYNETIARCGATMLLTSSGDPDFQALQENIDQMRLWREFALSNPILGVKWDV